MKRTRLCPKCHSSDLLRIEGNVGAYGVGNNIMTGATVFSAVKVHRYVCCSCGFTEEWIDTADIEKLRNGKKSTKV